MQKPKTGKISIFSPLDAKLGSLAGRVGLTQFPVGSSRVESGRVENMSNPTRIGLKMWATRLRIGSNSKCQPETRFDDQSSFD